MHGFTENKQIKITNIDEALSAPTDMRIFVISEALQANYSIDRIHELTMIDKWFLYKLKNIIDVSRELEQLGT
jgi:carbamoyl-phosphate synthase large subunit